ncbi:unnamed protein product [Prorocentrum cordatum]|uniref:Subtilisin n=1 Tax=Prorocentrum cordatum TaxID=2364126 RepID=A0ABN9VCG8_9DINO|nr:unnamed protein product [Polarella glacialis]
MMLRRTSHSVGALLLLLVARGAEGSASGRPREPQAEFGRRQASSGAQSLKLLAGDGVTYNAFGKSVAVSSDGARVVVGADYYYYDAEDAKGSAYVSDGARVVVGAFYDDDQGDRSGSAYVFDGTTGERLLKLVASDGAASDHFGISVAVSSDGARVVVGAKGDDDQGNNAGSAYVLDGTTGERLLKLLANDGAAGDEFGYSVAVSSDGARIWLRVRVRRYHRREAAQASGE